MFVNISRSKLLINSRRNEKKNRKNGSSSLRCNHCGGPVRPYGEIQTCVICSREVNHICSNCTHVRPGESLDKKKKSA